LHGKIKLRVLALPTLLVYFVNDTVAMDEDSQETRLFAVFERHDEFVAAQNTLLAVDLFGEPNREEEDVELDCSRKLIMIVSHLLYLGLTFLDVVEKVWRVPRTIVSVGPVP
jgi:hypothetical protein